MNFRRFSNYICAMSLAAACTLTTMGATLTDVTNTHWAYSSIVDLEERGVMALTSSGQFFPNQTMDYFEVADVLAKATGYVDIDVDKTISEAEKNLIKASYEKQKPTLAAYAAKYSTWNSAYNQQIAYLLGKGYISTTDLDKFMTKASNGEVKNIITKEELAVYAVRLLQKEKTAINTYTTTGFKDESKIQEANRPHMAYLKGLGLITADTLGNANGSMKVMKALCAKMVSSAHEIKEKSDDNSQGSNQEASLVTITKILTKNANEYYMCLKNSSGEAKYYSIKTTTKILDASGKEIAINKVVLESQAKVILQTENGTDYITSIQLVNTTSDSTTNGNTGSDSTNNTTNGSTSSDNTNTGNTTQTTTVSGTLLEKVSNNILRLNLADGTAKTYLLSENCIITLNGSTASASSLSVSDVVNLTIQNNTVTKVMATSGTGSLTSAGQVSQKKLSAAGYVLTLTQNGSTSVVTIPDAATITRNQKSADIRVIRMGDTLKVTKKNGIVTSVEATGVRSVVSGTIQEIHIGQTSKVIVNVNNEAKTYILGSDVEMYNNYYKEFINVRDLHLGQEVTLALDSEEVIALDVENTSTSVNIKGSIVAMGKSNAYMDVLVDYDYISGESKVYKRIELDSDTNITLNGKTQNRNVLKEGMEIVITYQYLDDKVPQKVLVIS